MKTLFAVHRENVKNNNVSSKKGKVISVIFDLFVALFNVLYFSVQYVEQNSYTTSRCNRNYL